MALFRDASAGCWEADASAFGGARILPMRLTAVARLTLLNEGSLAATTCSTSCSTKETECLEGGGLAAPGGMPL